jgi:hypothetical protein
VIGWKRTPTRKAIFLTAVRTRRVKRRQEPTSFGDRDPPGTNKKHQMRTAPRHRCSSWLPKRSTVLILAAALSSSTTPALFRRLLAAQQSRRTFSSVVVGAAYWTTTPFPHHRAGSSSGPSAGFCPSRSSTSVASFRQRKRIMATTSSSSSAAAAAPTSAPTTPWSPDDPKHAFEARENLQVWPLDASNAAYLQQVHPRGYTASTDTPHVRL